MAAVVVGATVAIGGSIIAGKRAKDAADAAGREKRAAQANMNRIRNQRGSVINPYADVKDLSSMAKDLSDSITNPFDNLGVATQAAEIKMEQTDIALANTLDTLRSTGASAGGATALAQAALESKKGIAASIESQEAQNEQLRAQGEQSANQRKMAEQQRLQGIAIAEGQRVQAAEAAGKQFQFQAKENRINQDLNNAAGQVAQAAANQASANQASASAWSSGVNAIAGIASSAIKAG